jgi:hypothetical protein
LVNEQTNLVDRLSYVGTPTELQQALRVTEINYHPSGPTLGESLTLPGIGNKDFEYVELMNIGAASINLGQAQFVEGILYTIPSNTTLAVGERLVIVHNLDAFTLRYGTNEAVLGNFMGNLDNQGERLRLQDAVGENILTFSYDQDWEPITDGAGRSLTVVDPQANYQNWGVPNQWRTSGKVNGSPGWDDQDLADLDRDGMADSWEVLHFGSTNASASADGDLDLANNLDEYVGGTAPGGAQSVLALRVKQDSGGQRIMLDTQSATGVGYTRLERRYTLEVTSDLHVPFTPIPGMDQVLGSGQTLMHTNQTDAVRYYRGRVELR